MYKPKIQNNLKYESLQYDYRVVQQNGNLFKIPAPTAATTLGLPWTALSANFGKF